LIGQDEAMSARLATDDEVRTWREDGWVLLAGLIGTDEIDAAAKDLEDIVPSADAFHADPDGETARWLGVPANRPAAYVWPTEGPGFRPEQGTWRGQFPFPGTGALNRLCQHPSIVDFARRALSERDIRIYQTGLTAKYHGVTNYEQPMHTDRNHSWLPPVGRAPWWNLQTFIYLSDQDEGCATHIVSRAAAGDRPTTVWGIMPASDAELYAAEQSSPGQKGSVLAYRNDVFHRGVDLTRPGAARFYLAVSFKAAGQDWIGFDGPQSRSTSPDWAKLVEGSTPDELALWGFPKPGHPIWDTELLDATGQLYPALDLTPWRDALANRPHAEPPTRR
jgi:hypothetical protein